MIGDRVRQIREMRGFTQEQLSELANLELQQINRYENNKNKPKADVIIQLARALNVSTDYLLGLIDTPHGHLGDELDDQETEIIVAVRSGDKLKAIEAIVSGH
jgi:transcriptional regulator with XRE-family HTH domain